MADTDGTYGERVAPPPGENIAIPRELLERVYLGLIQAQYDLSSALDAIDPAAYLLEAGGEVAEIIEALEQALPQVKDASLPPAPGAAHPR